MAAELTKDTVCVDTTSGARTAAALLAPELFPPNFQLVTARNPYDFRPLVVTTIDDLDRAAAATSTIQAGAPAAQLALPVGGDSYHARLQQAQRQEQVASLVDANYTYATTLLTQLQNANKTGQFALANQLHEVLFANLRLFGELGSNAPATLVAKHNLFWTAFNGTTDQTTSQDTETAPTHEPKTLGTFAARLTEANEKAKTLLPQNTDAHINDSSIELVNTAAQILAENGVQGAVEKGIANLKPSTREGLAGEYDDLTHEGYIVLVAFSTLVIEHPEELVAFFKAYPAVMENVATEMDAQRKAGTLPEASEQLYQEVFDPVAKAGETLAPDACFKFLMNLVHNDIAADPATLEALGKAEETAESFVMAPAVDPNADPTPPANDPSTPEAPTPESGSDNDPISPEEQVELFQAIEDLEAQSKTANQLLRGTPAGRDLFIQDEVFNIARSVREVIQAQFEGKPFPVTKAELAEAVALVPMPANAGADVQRYVKNARYVIALLREAPQLLNKDLAEGQQITDEIRETLRQAILSQKRVFTGSTPESFIRQAIQNVQVERANLLTYQEALPRTSRR